VSQLHTVHVRVNDAATGKPTPCRVRFTGPDGTYFAPFGRLTEFARDIGKDVGGNLWLPEEDKEYAYIDGTCEIALPAGRIDIEVSKGFEYTPLKERVDLKAGQLSIRLKIARWINLCEQGWYSGDMHVECMPPHATLLEAQAEDVAVVNLLARATFASSEVLAIPNIDAFSGQKPCLEVPGHMVVVNTVNWHPVLGELRLLNCHRVVYPLCFGNVHGFNNWTLAAWCDQCHRKGGLVIADPSKQLAEFVHGKADACWCDFGSGRPAESMRFDAGLWSVGFRFPLVTGSHKRSNQVVLGRQRTYARLEPGAEFNYRNWIEAVRSGRTFISEGAILDLQVNGQSPGAVIELEDSDEVLQVQASAQIPAGIPWFNVSYCGWSVDFVVNGGPSARIEAEIPARQGGWLIATCEGAQTSPVYVRVKGHPVPVSENRIPDLCSQLASDLEWARHEARCETVKQREELVAFYEQARQELELRAASST
jgi:hypothetical protein